MRITSDEMIREKAHELYITGQCEAEKAWENAQLLLEEELPDSRRWPMLHWIIQKRRYVIHAATIGASAATIAASLFAILSFQTGLEQFEQTQNKQKESIDQQKKSLDLSYQTQAFTFYNEYLKNKVEFAENPSLIVPLALSAAESIYELVGKEQDDWKATVEEILLAHKDSIESREFDCKALGKEFKEFVAGDKFPVTINCTSQ